MDLFSFYVCVLFYLCESKFDSSLFKGAGKLFELFQVTWLLGMRGHGGHRTDTALHDLFSLLEKYRRDEPNKHIS